jgi:YebC/PmpR family DNA-binding regulatory protein
MSGHSKWATIHRQKEAKDAKKGALFTKLAAQITVAVRQGGGIGDPDQNFRLRLVIDKAKQYNMPKENVNKAIERGLGTGQGSELEEVLYEGFLAGGAAVIAQALTDNKARTAQQVRTILERGGGSLGQSGAVSYLFSQKGEVRVKAQDPGLKSLQDQELEIIDLGIEDIEQDGDCLDVYCNKDETYDIREKLEKMGYQVESADLVMHPETAAEVGDGQIRERIESALNQLEDLEDVSKVWTNYQVEDNGNA